MKILCFEIKYVGFKKPEWKFFAQASARESDYTRASNLKIDAIKSLRQCTNANPDGTTKAVDSPGYVGLREAKETVEQYIEVYSRNHRIGRL